MAKKNVPYDQKYYDDVETWPREKLEELQLERLKDENGVSAFETVSQEFDVREFSPKEFLPAPCQGILAVECRSDDEELIALLRQISDPVSRARFDAERTLFCMLQADCAVPLGVHADVEPVAGADDASYAYRLSALLGDRKTSRAGFDLDRICAEIGEELSE